MSEENMPAPAIKPPPLPPSPLEKLNDFSDKLSPMLVKELRQGLRTNSFVILFLILQAFLALILLTTAAVDDSGSGEVISGIIFSLFSVAVLVIQPLRGTSAISSEIKGDTIDLMVLTRLSAWRITFGKWTSIVSQSLLILLAIVPYLILRYFFGGMQLFSELLLLFTIFALSGVFTALTVGLSASTLTLIRLLPLLGGIILIFPIFGLAFSGLDEVLELFTPKDSDHWLALISSYLFMIYLGYFFLEIGATTIAPASENRATRKRLLAFLALVLGVVPLSLVNETAAWVVGLILVSLVSLDFLTDSPNFPSIVTRPFLRWGLFGRLAGRFLYPGWPAGVLAHGLLFGILILLAFVRDFRFEEDLLESLGIIFGALHFPAFLINLFQKRIKNRFPAHVAITAACCILIPVFGIIHDIGRNDNDTIIWIFSFIPHIQPWLAFEIDPRESVSLAVIWGTAGFYFLANLLFALPHLLRFSRLEAEELRNKVTATEETAS